MIRKILAIKNVGVFSSYGAGRDVEFRRLTIIFGENGRGKTTLTAIFRSLQTGNAHYILGRRNLNAADPPEVSILLATQKATFSKGTWDALLTDMEVFDDAFVHQNVHAGDCVDHEHKKNLYRVIVGEEGVKFAECVDDLDSGIKEANKVIANKRAILAIHVPSGLSLDEFIAVPPKEGVEEEIVAKEAELAEFKLSSEIKEKGLLTRLALPNLPDEFHTLLSRELADVSKTAEAQVHAHMHASMDRPDEAWVAQGLQYAKDENCPFCGQGMSRSGLLEAYRSYFGEQYRALKRDIALLLAAVTAALSEKTLLPLQKAMADNHSLCQFWQQLMTLETPALSFDHLQSALEGLRITAQSYVGQKMAEPLEPLVPGSDFECAAAIYEEAKVAIEDHNRAIDTANKSIDCKKAETARADGEMICAGLARLKNNRLRYSAAVDQACRDFVSAGEAKIILDEDKKKAKKKLDEYTAGVFGKYQAEINSLLEKFNAGFRIGKTKSSYIGGTPSSSYVIVINKTAVELGDRKTPDGTPCFKNTLSAGDRSTLALAFFIARLNHDPRLADKTIVLDDPINSQDMSRATCTRQIICRLASQAKQIIVLSHNQYFLKHLWENALHREIKTLQLRRLADQSVVEDWDIETDTRGEYFQNYGVLVMYLEKGSTDLCHVARCIRLVLEEYLHVKSPQEFRRKEWLGTFIEKIRAADPASPLADARQILSELEDVNEFSKKYHHGGDSGADNEPITDRELGAYVNRTLKLVGRY
jgi:wobble nucleotide-excising tRNase